MSYSVFMLIRMSRCDLDLWPLDLALLQHFGCRVFKLCTKCERNQIIRGYNWRFSMFSPCNFRGWGTFTERFSGVRGPNFTKLGESVGQSFLQKKFVSEFRYVAAFSKAGCSNLSDVENDAKFCTFWFLWKVGERWERFLDQLLKLYIRSNLRNIFDGYPLLGCWARWIDEK